MHTRVRFYIIINLIIKLVKNYFLSLPLNNERRTKDIGGNNSTNWI